MPEKRIEDVPIPTISAKKLTKLYGVIHEDIMQARIKIAPIDQRHESGRRNR